MQRIQLSGVDLELSPEESPVRLIEKGPLPFRKDLWCPKIAAKASNHGSLLTAKTQPAIAISTAPKISNVFRPKLSATVVMIIVITAPPASAAANIQPMAVVVSPIPSR